MSFARLIPAGLLAVVGLVGVSLTKTGGPAQADRLAATGGNIEPWQFAVVGLVIIAGIALLFIGFRRKRDKEDEQPVPARAADPEPDSDSGSAAEPVPVRPADFEPEADDIAETKVDSTAGVSADEENPFSDLFREESEAASSATTTDADQSTPARALKEPTTDDSITDPKPARALDPEPGKDADPRR